MKKYKLKKWVKVVITLVVAIILLVSCYKALSWLGNIEKTKAYAEGRYIEYYTSTGEVFYK